MKKITIGRYGEVPEALLKKRPDLRDSYVDIAGAGWIEGERDDGTSWIMFLETDGSPVVFWGRRDEDGGVIGDGILLQP